MKHSESPHTRWRNDLLATTRESSTITEYRILVGGVAFRAESLGEAEDGVEVLKKAAPYLDPIIQKREVVAQAWAPLHGKD